MNSVHRFWRTMACLAIFFVGMWAGQYRVLHGREFAAKLDPQHQGRVLGQEQAPPTDLVGTDVDFRLFWDLWKLLKDKYYEQPIKDKDLLYGAMAGLAAGTGDPYTNYFEPNVAEAFQQSLEGSFGGIGAEIGIKKDALQIVAPLPDTPADRAGLLAGDLIIKIDGEDTVGMSVEKAVHLIRGERGTKVTLTLYRVAEKKNLFEVTLIREDVHVKSVKWKMLPERIALIEVNHFNSDTRSGFDEAVRAILTQHPRGLILDLRNNPGGLLDTSLDMAADWVGNQVVVKERRQGKIFAELRGKGQPRLQALRTVVLVNQGSASASEIVAGALQDYEEATLIGTKTFGKGSVQELQSLPDGSAVKITVAEWLTPKERTIHKTGLAPDILVEQTPEDYEAKRDPPLDRAVAFLTGAATSTRSGTTTSTRP